MKTRRSRIAALGAGVLLAATLAACSSSGGSGDNKNSSPAGSGGNSSSSASTDSKPVTITWWHNSNNDPGKSYYEKVAADYHAAHPNVTINISAMAHEDMLTKLDAAFQSGDMPDIYMERGGGELADHVDAGLVKDLSDSAKDIIAQIGGAAAGWQIDGKTYALPFSMGVVGFWYNKDLFAQAGITAAPTTMDELYADWDKLKAKGITPVSVGAGDKWPAAHYWYYLALRECKQQVLQDAVKSYDFSDPCFVKAGEDLKAIVAKNPFQKGWLTAPGQKTPTGASGLLATGKVAMELAGHWEPGVMQGLTADKKGLGDKAAWFPFPAVAGGQGDPKALLGGGDAWAVSKKAPDAAVDFVKYLLSDEVQNGFAQNDMGLPTIPGATGAVKDPALAGLIQVRNSSPYIQLYFDTAFGDTVGGDLNDAIVSLLAGQASPQDVVDKFQKSADENK